MIEIGVPGSVDVLDDIDRQRRDPAGEPEPRETAPCHEAERRPAPSRRSPLAPLSKARVPPRAVALAAGVSVLLQGIAVTCSREGAFGVGLPLFFTAVVLPYGVAVGCLLAPDLPATARRWVLVVSGTLPTVIFRLTDPLLLTGYDEQLHLRTLSDLQRGGPLFSPNPLLPASARYPGLELLTALVQRATHLPTMVAVTIVVLACRVLLVLTIYRLAALVIKDRRIASLAVMFYAASPQFYFFNSQFAYQTLALALALGGLTLLARATRTRERRWWSALAAMSCFAAAVITHHLTVWVVAAGALAWCAAARRGDRRLVGSVALGTVLLAALWAVPFASGLAGYLGPLFDQALSQVRQLFGGGDGERAVFTDSAGVGTPVWERVVLVGYAVLCTVAAATAAFVILRRGHRNRSPMLLAWGSLCLAYPLAFAARLAPKASEICDRATTFTFLPLALGVAFVIRSWTRRSPAAGGPARRLRRPAATVIVVCSGLAYLGGLILGSGPDWGHLPGKYLAVADSRSLDPETLAAVAWSERHLEPGESIMADRVPGTLLASVAHLWVDQAPRPGAEPASLYFSETWGAEQTRTARVMRLRYLYVDSRLAESAPHQRWYFYPGETPRPRRLPARGLAKFSEVPGVTAVYRHGPIAIYDLKGLRVESTRRGWTGSRRPDPWRDAGLGLPLGALLAWRAAALRRLAALALTTVGGSGLAASAISAAILVSAGMAAVGFLPGWGFFAALGCPPIAATLARLAARARAGRLTPAAALARPSGALIVVAALAVALAAVGAGLALRSAWLTDVVKTGEIVTAVEEAR